MESCYAEIGRLPLPSSKSPPKSSRRPPTSFHPSPIPSTPSIFPDFEWCRQIVKYRKRRSRMMTGLCCKGSRKEAYENSTANVTVRSPLYLYGRCRRSLNVWFDQIALDAVGRRQSAWSSSHDFFPVAQAHARPLIFVFFCIALLLQLGAFS